MTIRLVASNDNPIPKEAEQTFDNVVPLNTSPAKAGLTSDQITPREALLDVLHEIDTGALNPDVLVICIGTLADGVSCGAEYRNVSPNMFTAIGVIESVKAMLAS